MSDAELDQIIAKLRTGDSGEFPEQAIRAAQQRREEIVPRLIELIRREIEHLPSHGSSESDGHLYALYLLAEFRAREAWPTILEGLSLPGELPFDLFRDVITDDFPILLPLLVDGDASLIDDLVANRSLDPDVRWAGAASYMHMVRAGQLEREDAARRLMRHIEQARDPLDEEILYPLVLELEDYAIPESLSLIEEVYPLAVPEPFRDQLDETREKIALGDVTFQRSLLRLPDPFSDTVEATLRWFARDSTNVLQSPWQSERDDDDFDDFDDDDIDDDETDEHEPEAVEPPLKPVVNEKPRVGRNEPCPCGSGKKYKKCCGGRAAQIDATEDHE